MKYEVTDAIMTQAIHAAIQETGLLKLISTLDFELKAVKEENKMLVDTLDKIATEADETWCEWTMEGPLPGDAVRFAASILNTARDAITVKEPTP